MSDIVIIIFTITVITSVGKTANGNLSGQILQLYRVPISQRYTHVAIHFI